VRAVIAMAQTLGLEVTSEGIETLEQLRMLRDLGCDSGQGYLFARPIPADEVSRLLRSNPVMTMVGARSETDLY